jgi:hypothetical protein
MFGTIETIFKIGTNQELCTLLDKNAPNNTPTNIESVKLSLFIDFADVLTFWY